jgi:hypothetical protein
VVHALDKGKLLTLLKAHPLCLKISIDSFTSLGTIALVNEIAPEFSQSILCPSFIECSAINDFSVWPSLTARSCSDYLSLIDLLVWPM